MRVRHLNACVFACSLIGVEKMKTTVVIALSKYNSFFSTSKVKKRKLLWILSRYVGDLSHESGGRSKATHAGAISYHQHPK